MEHPTTPAPMVAAAIDIGSNSVHLLVAAVREHRLEALLDESVFLGLGEAVAARPTLGGALLSDLVAVVGGYVERAVQLGASRIALVATEPLRRATDAHLAVVALERRYPITIAILGHDEEAMLTLLGATAGRRPTGELLVVDVGGGSTEFVVVSPDAAPVAHGIRVGSADLTARLVHADPPTPGEVQALLAEARRLVAGAPDAHPREVILVGGTASNLLRLVAAGSLDRRLTRTRVAAALAAITAEPAEQAAARHAIRPARARTLTAGAAIVLAILEHYRLRSVRVSEASIREGAVLAVAQAGSGWRSRLNELATGSR
jgi:exopolyphosphatase/pppGpp-phosphohydrolase